MNEILNKNMEKSNILYYCSVGILFINILLIIFSIFKINPGIYINIQFSIFSFISIFCFFFWEYLKQRIKVIFACIYGDYEEPELEKINTLFSNNKINENEQFGLKFELFNNIFILESISENFNKIIKIGKIIPIIFLILIIFFFIIHKSNMHEINKLLINIITISLISQILIFIISIILFYMIKKAQLRLTPRNLANIKA